MLAKLVIRPFLAKHSSGEMPYMHTIFNETAVNPATRETHNRNISNTCAMTTRRNMLSG